MFVVNLTILYIRAGTITPWKQPITITSQFFVIDVNYNYLDLTFIRNVIDYNYDYVIHLKVIDYCIALLYIQISDLAYFLLKDPYYEGFDTQNFIRNRKL